MEYERVKYCATWKTSMDVLKKQNLFLTLRYIRHKGTSHWQLKVGWIVVLKKDVNVKANSERKQAKSGGFLLCFLTQPHEWFKFYVLGIKYGTFQ